MDVDVDAGHDQDQRTFPMAIKPAAAQEDAESAPASPGACSSLSSAGPSIFTGSPMGSTPHQGHKGDASSRYRASDDQQQQFKWSENPMLSMASPAASLSTPTSGAGVFHTPASVSQLQPRGAGDKFFTPYNNSAFNDATVGSSDQFYTPVEHGMLRAMQRTGPPSAGRQPSCHSPSRTQRMPRQGSGCAGGLKAEVPHESAQGNQSAASLRSISNVGSPASPRKASSRAQGGTEERQQGAQSAASLRSISNVGSPASPREVSSRAQGEAEERQQGEQSAVPLRSISNVGSPLDEGAGEGEQQSGEWDDSSICGDGGGNEEGAALSPAGSTCARNPGTCLPAAEAEQQVKGAADADDDLAPEEQQQPASPGAAPSTQALYEAPDSPVEGQRAHSVSTSPCASPQQGGLPECEEGPPNDATSLLSAAEGGIHGEGALEKQQRDHAAEEGQGQAEEDHAVGEGQGQEEEAAVKKDPAAEEGQGQEKEAAVKKDHAAEEGQGQEEEAAEKGQAGAEEAAGGLAPGGATTAGASAEGPGAADLGEEAAAAFVGAPDALRAGAEGPRAADLSEEQAAAAAAAVGADAQAGKSTADDLAHRTGSPARHDPRMFAASLSSKGRQGRWVCGHANTPTLHPSQHPPKPNTTAIPDHLLKASHLVLRTNRPEPDPVSARRLKMTVPKTPVLATAQRLGSLPHAHQSPAPSSAAPAAPDTRPRRASYTHTPTRTQSMDEHAAAGHVAPGGKPRRASYTHTPTQPPSTTLGLTHAPLPAPAVPLQGSQIESQHAPPAPPAVPQQSSYNNEGAADADADDNDAPPAPPAVPRQSSHSDTDAAACADGDDAAAVAARFANLPSRITSSESRRVAGAAPSSERGAAAAPNSAPTQPAVTCAKEAGAAVPKAASSMAARESARASAAAAAAAAARAKAQHASPLKKAAHVTGAQRKPTPQDPKQAADKAPGLGKAAINDGGTQASAAGGAEKDPEQAAQGSAPACPAHRAAPAGPTAAPPKPRPLSAAAAPAKKVAGAASVPTIARPHSATANQKAGTAGAAATPPKTRQTNPTTTTPQRMQAQRAAGTPPPRAQQQRSASVAPQPGRGAERKAWPGLPPTRAQQRSASVAQPRRPAAPTLTPALHATAATTTTPERHKGRSTATAAARLKAQHAPAAGRQQVVASAAAHPASAHAPAVSSKPTAVARPNASTGARAVGCSSKAQRPASSHAPTATPPKAAAPAAAASKIQRPASSPAPSTTPPKAAAPAAAVSKVQRPASSPAPSTTPPKAAAPAAAASKIQRPAALPVGSKGHLSAAPLPTAAKEGSKPGVTTNTASKAAAPPAPPTAATAPAAAPAVAQKKPAVPKLSRKPTPSAPAPTPAHAAPAAALEPLPSFFKKPGVPRLSAKAAAAAVPPAAAPAVCTQLPHASKADKQADAAAARASKQAEAAAARANKQAQAEEAKARRLAEAAAAKAHKQEADAEAAAAKAHKQEADAEAEKAKAHKQAKAGAEKAQAADQAAQQARAVEQARVEATRAQQEGAGAAARAQEDPSVNAEAAAKQGGEARVPAEEEVARTAAAGVGANTAAPSVFVRPQVPKLNMEAVAAAAARDNEEEEQANKGPPFAPPPPLQPPPPHTQHSTGSDAAFKAPATAPAKPVEATSAASKAQQSHHGPPRPTTAPAGAATAAASAKVQGTKAAAASGAGGAGAAGVAGVGRPRRNSAALPQVRPPGMWSPPPPLRGAANKEQQQLPSKAPAAARGNAPGRARRNSCTAALTSHSNAAGLAPGASRAAAMAASLQAVKEEGAAAQLHTQAPSCNGNNASNKGGPSSISASPAKGVGRMSAADQQVRVSPVGGMTFGTPVSEQKVGSNSARNRYSSCLDTKEDSRKEEAASSLTPKPREGGPTDLSLAWATTPYTSTSFVRILQPTEPASAAGSSVSLNNSPSGSDSVPQMPSLGLVGSLMPTPFVPAAGGPVAPMLHDSLNSSSGGSSSGGGSFSLCIGHKSVGGGDGVGDAAALQQQLRQQGSGPGQQPSVLDSCRSIGGGRPSLGVAAMTPVLMHPFAVATPAPKGMEQETPRLGLQPERRVAEDAATPAGLTLLTPAPQLPSAQELEQLVHRQHAQQEQEAHACSQQQQQQQQQQGAEQEPKHPSEVHLTANLPSSETFVWDTASYEVCSPGASVPHGYNSAGPHPLPQYEEWGSPDDSPIHDCAEARDQSQLGEQTKVAKLQAPGDGVKSSLDIAGAHANFSFTSEIGALRMSTFEPATLPRAP